jgi:putative addiction module component (TIGR02574 family)
MDMAVTLTPEQQQLSVEEKLDLIALLWDSLPEDQLPMPEWQLKLLEERLAEFEADPDEGQSWEEVKAELEQES